MTKPCPVCGVETDCEHREKLWDDKTWVNAEPFSLTIPKQQRFKCPKCGYEVDGYGMFITIIADEKGNPFSANICICCYMKWLAATFPNMVAIEAELHVETEDEHQARINGISYNGD